MTVKNLLKMLKEQPEVMDRVIARLKLIKTGQEKFKKADKTFQGYLKRLINESIEDCDRG